VLTGALVTAMAGSLSEGGRAASKSERSKGWPVPKSPNQTDRSPAPTPPEPSRSKLDTLGVPMRAPFEKIRPPLASVLAFPPPLLRPMTVNVTSPSALVYFRTVLAVQLTCAFGSIWSAQISRSAQAERSITTE